MKNLVNQVNDVWDDVLKLEIERLVERVDDVTLKHFITNFPKLYKLGLTPKLEVRETKKYYKLVMGKTTWGFIVKNDGVYKNENVFRGDLMKAATHNTPAKHSRGNIIKGTDMWTYLGPVYLK